MTKRVLLTGASGFIGRHCLTCLLSSDFDEVHAANRHGARPFAENVNWHGADLRDPVQARELIKKVRPTHLLHSAWIATPGIYSSSADNLAWLEGSISLFRAFGQSGGERIVGVGTSAEYLPDEHACHEQRTILAPLSIYGKSKLACMNALEISAQAYDFSAAWGRVFVPYGPGDPDARLFPSVLKSLLAREDIALTHGEQVRDFIYAPDAGALLVQLLGSNCRGAFNVGTGVGYSVRSAIEMLAQKVDAVDRLNFGARKMKSGEPDYLVADMTRTFEHVGCRIFASLDRGLSDIVQNTKDLNVGTTT